MLFRSPLDETAQDHLTTYSLDIQNRQLLTAMGIERELENEISRYINNITGRDVSIRLHERKNIGISINGKYVENIPIVGEGYGTNQLITLLFITLRAMPGSTILIEEPEIHLHPKAQSELSETLVEIAQKQNKQLLITTHSEHIIYRLLSLIKRGIISKNDLNIYHFEEVNGTCKPELLETTKNGIIKGGLRSFFEAEMDNLKFLSENFGG